jgi:hypothetical protein
MHCCTQDKVNGPLKCSWDLYLTPLFIFNQLGGLIDT